MIESPVSGHPAPLIMGILNTSPDSFWAGSRVLKLKTQLKTARRMLEAGARILDIGGASTRPGARPPAEELELKRVLPLIKALEPRKTGLRLSIDTRSPLVAREALKAGAEIINDIGGLRDPVLRELAAELGAGVIIMHMRGEPETMQLAPRYQDVLSEVDEFFARQIEACLESGIARERIWLDPGIGFGKRLEDNLALIKGLTRFKAHACPLVLGVSRKSFIGEVTGDPVSERVLGTALYNFAGLLGGAEVLRVHDVEAASRTILVWHSLFREKP